MDNINTLHDVEMLLHDAVLVRNGTVIDKPKVDLNERKHVISFLPDTPCPPQPGDVVKINNKSFVITEVTENLFFHNTVYSIDASYGPSSKSASPSSQQVFHINTVNNSILGSQHNASISVSYADVKQEIERIDDEKDRAELQKLMQRVEAALEDNQPLTKGFFAKFSDVLVKHQNLISTFGTLIFNHLLGQ